VIDYMAEKLNQYRIEEMARHWERPRDPQTAQPEPVAAETGPAVTPPALRKLSWLV
jgi:hypothetical protein